MTTEKMFQIRVILKTEVRGWMLDHATLEVCPSECSIGIGTLPRCTLDDVKR